MALRTQVEINAPAERVWEIMGNLREWSSFNSFLKIENAPDTPAPGQSLRVSFQPPGHAKPTVMAPQVVAYKPGTELRWRGKLFGSDLFFVGEHFFTLQPVGTDRTLLLHGEDFKGCLVPLLGSVLADTKKGFVEFNEGLKRAAEQPRDG
ncbi:hypothetical protein VOLCADRAFT_117866 [Volvox carteri f. nagariensis]|uniref:Coenzyme Q-binding protein COQ10 START domain-containing protein n=1 Tax=Volvox carteri f. nagariensis TaxID=3068 RepID=D8TYT6_VOLCA|nr:uncharacterized protein VOLCADRAFT_117866 [Volvox carteri f. nagariensis]EFJ47369.1 hypothetical protein VOLCADRAFT_117866 [Volvox carteri f. nagariensis]|eukprot:XP_002951558.1 hypothetical protein VOLCADRAFT_117866 [Volvox carteri f. nagariensis]